MTTLQRLRRKAWFQWACVATVVLGSISILILGVNAALGSFA